MPRIAARSGRPPRKAKPFQAFPPLLDLKLRAIDLAFDRFDLRSATDLGAVWGVNAGYSFYIASRKEVERVVICDGKFNDPVREQAARDPRIELAQGYLGSPEIRTAVGQVDATVMFDILLHQVRPDWDEMLRLYAETTKCFILAGPWWRGPATVRLTDLPREEYLELLPSKREGLEPTMDKLDEVHPWRERPWRDVADIWQWGIADADLRARMGELGFVLAHHENHGRWADTDRFDDCSYVFVREELL